LVRAERRAEQLGFPKGPYSLGYARFVETWVRIEAGEVDRAEASAAELAELAERHGFDQWRLVAGTQQSTIAAMKVLGADSPGSSELTAHLATLADLTDTLLKLGLAIYATSFAAHLGRLMIAAGKPAEARERLNAALSLAETTDMHLYDAELLRLRAQTSANLADRLADIAKAAALARSQGATLFELRCALDDFQLRGEPARAALTEAMTRLPAGDWPERRRAQAFLSGPVNANG